MIAILSRETLSSAAIEYSNERQEDVERVQVQIHRPGYVLIRRVATDYV